MTNKGFFELGPAEERICLLCQNDPLLAKLIGFVGPVSIAATGDPFEFLVRAIVGQQLSVKAAETISRRIEEYCGSLSPEAILAASEDGMRGAGLSRPKIRYMKELAEQVNRQAIDLTGFDAYSDEEVLAKLMRIKGIGRWTAEMFLIFALGRSDILSLGDAGLRRAARWLHASEEVLSDIAHLEKLGERWKPYRSVASIYLWEAIDRGYVKSKEPLFLSDLEG